MKEYDHRKKLSLEVCWETAKQITEHKRKLGYDPKSIFMEENAHIFREPSWRDVHALYYARLISQSPFDNSVTLDMEIEECI